MLFDSLFVRLFFLFSRQTKKWIVLSGILELVLSAPSSVNSPSLWSYFSLIRCVTKGYQVLTVAAMVSSKTCVLCLSLLQREKNQTCVFRRCWRKLLAPYCHFYYAPLCRTEWRQLDGFISQVRFIYGFSDRLHSHKCSFFLTQL